MKGNLRVFAKTPAGPSPPHPDRGEDGRSPRRIENVVFFFVALATVFISLAIHLDFGTKAPAELIDNSHFSHLNGVLIVHDGRPDSMGWLSLVSVDQADFHVNRMAGFLTRLFGLRRNVILLVPLFGGVLTAMFGFLLGTELGGRRAGTLVASTLMTTPLVFGNARTLCNWTLVFASFLALVWLLARYHRRLTALDAAFVGLAFAGCVLLGNDDTSHLIFLGSAGLVVTVHVCVNVLTKRLTARDARLHAAVFAATILMTEVVTDVHRRLAPIFGSFGYDYYIRELYQFGQRYGIWRGLPYYAVDLWTNTLRPGGAVLCALGLAAFALWIPQWRRRPMLWALGLGFSGLSLLTKKNGWYGFEFTLLAVVLAAIGAAEAIGRMRTRYAVAGWIAWHTLLILQMADVTYSAYPAMPASAYHRWAGGYAPNHVAGTLNESGKGRDPNWPRILERLAAELASNPNATIALALEEDNALNVVPFAIRTQFPGAHLRSACEPDLPPLGQGLDLVAVIPGPVSTSGSLGPFPKSANAEDRTSDAWRFCVHPFRVPGFAGRFSADRFESNMADWRGHTVVELAGGVRLYLPGS